MLSYHMICYTMLYDTMIRAEAVSQRDLAQCEILESSMDLLR